MPIPLHISPKLLPSIASLYNDTNRIFMEYIDNALDSAETFYDKINKSYLKGINITLKVEGNAYKQGKVIISDNCSGITNFKKVVQSIGDSDKQGQFTTNGQFGYGIYSFMAAREKLEITSRTKNNDALYLSILKSQFNAKKQEDVKFNDPKVVSFEDENGTIIILSHFEKNMWKAIDLNHIKIEVEQHFELLLNRKNLTIKIVEPGGTEYVCKPFNYDEYQGEKWEEKIEILATTKGRKQPKQVEFKLNERLDQPIKMFLKITKGRIINKNPVFIIKGRRIAEIKDVKSFRTNHKGNIWSHPNLTGYVDLGGFLEPTIARTDFKNTSKSKAVFEKLFELEPLILEFLKEINKKSDEKHYKELEDELNKALSKLAKIDNMNFRTEPISGSKISGIHLEDEKDEDLAEEGQQEFYDGKGKYEWKDKKDLESEQNGNKGDASKKSEENKNPFEDDNQNIDQKKKSGFNIEISDRDPDIDAESKKEQRSSLVGGTILIYRKHPDFLKRVDQKRTGESKITQRLITYLAGEVTVHYKDKLITREGQPDYNKKMFSNVVEFIYKFEEMLNYLDGKNLGDIGDEGTN